MLDATLTDFRNHAKRYLDAVERGESVRIYRKGRPIAELVPISSRTAAWKNSPSVRLRLGELCLSDEIAADRARSR